MKFLRAKFKNFRLLKDLEFEFSTDPVKNLTVIRAANETGKTTSKNALIWALYGSESLPKQGKGFPLHPADVDKKVNDKVEISVEIDFSVDEVVSFKGNTLVKNKKYRLIRSCTERIQESGFVRSPDSVTLNELTEKGAEPVIQSDIKRRIEQALPELLKDVFFTDGDAAMSFIAADSSTYERRKRVKEAVESLLGLKDLDALIKRTAEAKKEFHSEIDKTNYSEIVEKLEDKKQFQLDEIEDNESDLQEKNSQLKDAQERYRLNQDKIDECLRQGDKSKLLAEKNKIKADIEKQEALSESALKALRKVFRDESLAYSLVKDGISKAVSLLGAMEKDKKLPKQSIPVLSELLEAQECFCGSSLKGEEGVGRVEHIKHIIKISEESDRIQAAATEVYYGMKSFSDTQSWMDEYNDKAELYFKAGNVLKDLQLSYELKEKEIDQIDDELLAGYRAIGNKLSSEISRLIAENAKHQQSVVNAKALLVEINSDLEKASKKLNKDDSAVKRYNLAGLVNDVFSGVLGSIREVELKRVSDEMNRIFLQMIGSDPEANQHVIIKSAELTEDFDIVVLGPNGHKLDPDQDLNGASRRAITLAFILALTKVSGVEAPNVIDTPLGMMSGYVKQSVLLRTIEESSQPILFLTHSEINDVEEILDKRAGVVFTLTNPGHYPLQLVNPSGVSDSRVVKCGCNHRSHCNICERRSTDLLETA
ncbi:hypothetical protein SSTU70S_00135 [Stutzerimonas stutzeri]